MEGLPADGPGRLMEGIGEKIKEINGLRKKKTKTFQYFIMHNFSLRVVCFLLCSIRVKMSLDLVKVHNPILQL